MTNDRELARQAIAELMEIRRKVRELPSQAKDACELADAMSERLVDLIDWLHQYCTL